MYCLSNRNQWDNHHREGLPQKHTLQNTTNEQSFPTIIGFGTNKSDTQLPSIITVLGKPSKFVNRPQNNAISANLNAFLMGVKYTI